MRGRLRRDGTGASRPGVLAFFQDTLGLTCRCRSLVALRPRSAGMTRQINGRMCVQGLTSPKRPSLASRRSDVPPVSFPHNPTSFRRKARSHRCRISWEIDVASFSSWSRYIAAKRRNNEPACCRRHPSSRRAPKACKSDDSVNRACVRGPDGW